MMPMVARSFIFWASCSVRNVQHAMCIEHVSAIKFHNAVAARAVQFRVAYVSYTPSPPNYQRQYLNEEECHRVFSVTRHRLLLPFIDYLPSQDGSHAVEFMNAAAVIIHPEDRFVVFDVFPYVGIWKYPRNCSVLTHIPASLFLFLSSPPSLFLFLVRDRDEK